MRKPQVKRIIAGNMDRERGRSIPRIIERRSARPLTQGVFETALLYVKDVFSEETMGVGDASFWVRIEQKAGLFKGTRKQALFQYYMRGYTHVWLAETLLDYFPQFRASVGLGTMSPSEKENRVSRLSSALFEDFPPRYKRAHRPDELS